MNLHLKVNGQDLPVRDGSVDLKKTSPLFVRDGIPSIRSLPFSFPALPDIRKLLGAPDNVDNYQLPNALPYELYLRESIYLQSQMEVREATEERIEGHLLDAVGEFADEWGRKTLREFDLGSVDYRVTKAKITFEILASGDPTAFTITLNGNDYFRNISGGDTPADVTQDLADDINADFPGYATRSGGSNEFLKIEQPNTGDAWELSWVPEVGGTTRVVIANQTTLVDARQTDYQAWFEDVAKDNPTNYNYCLPMMNSRGWVYGGENPLIPENGAEGLINYYYQEPILNSLEDSEQWKYTCMPCVYLRHILEKVLEAAGYTLEVESEIDTNRDFAIAWMLNLYAIDEVIPQWDESAAANEYCNVFKGAFDLNELVPDMAVADFLKGIVITFLAQFDWYPEEGKVVLRAADDVFYATSEHDWSDMLISKPHVKYLYNKGYTLKHAIDESDEMYTRFRNNDNALANLPNYLNEVDPYVYGLGEEEIQNPFGIMPTIPRSYTPVSAYYIPEINRKGYSDYFGLGYGDWTPRIGFFRGFTEGTTDDYPGGRSDDLDNLGVHIAGAYSLAWGGTYGLVETRYKAWLYFMANTRPVELYLDPELVKLSDLDPDIPKRLLDQKWILHDYTLKVPGSGKVKVVLYRF